MSSWHDLPTQDDVQIPLLRAIERRGGTIVVSDKRDEIWQELADLFGLTNEQLEYDTSEGRNLWWNWIRYTRLTLVEDGYLQRNTRNRWTITDSGKRMLARLR